MFRAMNDRLFNAVMEIKKECASHAHSCAECPFWLNGGTVKQYCGLNWIESFEMMRPETWEVKDRVFDKNDGWISVNDRLPDEPRDVWVYTKNGELTRDSYDRNHVGCEIGYVIGEEQKTHIQNGWWDNDGCFDEPLWWKEIEEPDPPEVR